MRLPPSLSLRLAMLYTMLFTISVLLLGGALYWATVHTPLQAVSLQVEREMSALSREYLERGRDALAAALELRAAGGDARMPFHAFIAPDGSVVAANLPSWPREQQSGWSRLEADYYQNGDEVDHEALTLDRRFEDGARLLVGRDIEDIDEVEEKLLAAVSGLLVGTLLLGLLGGVLMSHAIGRRIGLVTRTARRVMRGDLSGRIPLRGTADDFDQLGATLNEMLARIEALVESVRRVSDNVAHELRTPLSRLRASLEELRPAQVVAGGAAIENAIAEASALEKTFDAVLRIARIESGRHGAEFSPVDLSALLADAAELYAPAAEERGQSLQMEVAPGLRVAGDRDLLFQSFCNLLDNAIKYTPVGGWIAVRAGLRAGGVEVAITDDGPGISDADRPHLTERFFRAAATMAEPGAGLGLSLVAAVARLHGATLAFEDARPGLAARWSMRSA